MIRKTLLLPLLLVASNYLSAQTSCSKTPYNCEADLVNPLFSEDEIASVKDIPYVKNNLGSGMRPVDVGYKGQCNDSKNCYGDGRDLIYDVFFPSSHNYNACPLPVIFIFHPGNFSDCSSNRETRRMSTLFAQRGFVAVNVEYRRGTNEDPDGYVSASKTLALYRASQDGRGAIRSVIARQLDGTSTPYYRIDTNNIFIGDAGTNPLNIAYITDQKEMDLIAPGVKPVLGPIYANYYYGDTSIKYTIKGVFNESGGLLLAPSYKLQKMLIGHGTQNLPALISFHGLADKLIAPGIKYEYYSVTASYKTEMFCTRDMSSYTVPRSTRPFPDIIFAGSQSLYDVLTSLNVPCELYLDSKMAHSLFTSSGFGTGITNTDSLEEYIVQRVATFFQAVINGIAANLKTTTFLDCANYRSGCITKNFNSCLDAQKIAAPNASPQIFTVKQINRVVYLNFASATSAQVEVYDLNGLRWKSLRVSGKSASLNLADLKAGIYILKATQGTTTQSQKLLLN